MKNITRLIIAAMVAMAFAACGDKTGGKTDAGEADKAVTKKDAPVKVEMYVMSKCPYGVQAVDGFAPVMKTLEGVVDLQLDYIGVEDDAGKLTTMHGETELVGNIVQLCAGEQAPEKHLEFITCMNEEWRKIPENWEECGKKVGLDTAALGKCKDGDEGRKLLSASFKRSKEAGAQGSPTIKVNGEDYQGGRMPNDFSHFICDSYGEKLDIAKCKDLPAPPKVLVTVITDARCGPPCNPEPVFANLKQVFAGLETKVMYWEEPETQKLADELGITMLPAVFFDKSIDEDPSGKSQIQRWLEPKGDRFELKVKPEFDPRAEVCDNQKDDTGNGKVDCDDPDCTYSLKCREETSRELELFIMSQCPYGMVAAKAMKDLLDAFGKDMAFKLHFIAGQKPDGSIDSMHGPTEVEEDIRMLCAAKHYPKGNKYLEYIWCRSADVRDNEWKKCTGNNGISTAVIEKCVKDEGTELLNQDIKIAQGLGIGASPTWIANGKTMFGGLMPHSVQLEYCKVNSGLEGCGKKLAGSDDGHGHGGDGQGGPEPGMQRPEQPAPSCGN